MIRQFPPDWAPQDPPSATRVERAVDALFDRCPFWDQLVLAVLFALYVIVMSAVIVHMVGGGHP